MKATWKRTGLGYLAVAGLLATAWHFRPPPEHRMDVVAVARDGIRPVVLPLLWTQRAEVRETGTRMEQATRLRDIARLIPSWVDGEILAAASLADAAPLGADPPTRWRHLATALGWLTEARHARGDGPGSPDLLFAMATMLTTAMEHDPELRPEAVKALPESPEATALQWLEEAAAIRPTSVSLARVRYLRPVVLLGHLRDGRLASARESWSAAMLALEQSPDPAAARWREALSEVGKVLHESDRPVLDPATRARWQQDPFLAPFAEVISD